MLKPLTDGILIKRDEPPKQIGLIHVPDNVRQSNVAKTGIVLAVGPGRRFKKTGYLIPMEVKIGDRVLFDPLAELRCVDEKESIYAGVQYQLAAILDPK